MSGDPRSDLVSRTPLPAWASAYQLETRADGHLWLHATIDGCEVFAQPKAWSNMTFAVDRPASTGALNYGLQMEGLAGHSGQIETNDPNFGSQLMAGSRAGQECPAPQPGAAGQSQSLELTWPALILAGGFIVAALISRLMRKAG